MKSKIRDYVLMTLGVAISVCGLNLFLVPNNIAAGGVSGIAMILHYLFQVNLGLTIAVLNIPLFIFGFKKMGKSFAIRTAYCLALYSVLAAVIPADTPPTKDIILGCLYGGVLMGTGLGIVIKVGGSTGGSDMAGVILNARFKSFSISTFVLMIDFLVIGTAAFVFKNEGEGYALALYAIASLYISTKLMDFISVGLHAAKAFYIISDKNDEIARMILEKMDRGVTALSAKGVYTGREKTVLMCVIQWRTEGARLKSLVKSVDPHAFVIVGDVKEVMGEGF
jgi:uncharacterized membrane-anchored protein YitT (DUF2179 family)